MYQSVSALLEKDIKTNVLPQSILLSGSIASGKLTCALEIARVINCTGSEKGSWLCQCNSCLKHKQLNASNLIIAGSRDCILEIEAANNTFQNAVMNNSSYVTAARFLFLRSVRKLTLRFSPILWEDDDKISKIATVVSAIDEDMETLDPAKPLPPFEKLEKLLDSIVTNCKKLENTFMYDSIPVAQIRKVSTWARLSDSSGGKKVFIIENADRMQESVRNALLKILEEPPQDMLFILTTARRGAVMPTILSRVRTYSFYERNYEQQHDVIKRVFHEDCIAKDTTIESYLSNFLPVKLDVIKNYAKTFFNSLLRHQPADIQQLIKEMNNFEPRLILKLFMNSILENMGDFLKQPDLSQIDLAKRTEYAQKLLNVVKSSYDNITIYNLSPISSLESMYERLLKTNN